MALSSQVTFFVAVGKLIYEVFTKNPFTTEEPTWNKNSDACLEFKLLGNNGYEDYSIHGKMFMMCYVKTAGRKVEFIL